MLASTLTYLGGLLVLIGFTALLCPRRLLNKRGRAAGVIGAVVGIFAGLMGAALPAGEVAVGHRRQRLDDFMPRYQFHERHSLIVAAPPDAVDRAIRNVTADEIRFYRTLTWIRRRGRRGPGGLLDAPRDVPLLAVATRGGFHVLADEPGREIVVGITLPVSAAARDAARTHGRPRFAEPSDGYAIAAMNFRVVPDRAGASLVSTETRVFARDAVTRRAFAHYWRVIYPGSALIRRGWLAAIKRRAEESAADNDTARRPHRPGRYRPTIF